MVCVRALRWAEVNPLMKPSNPKPVVDWEAPQPIWRAFGFRVWGLRFRGSVVLGFWVFSVFGLWVWGVESTGLGFWV